MATLSIGRIGKVAVGLAPKERDLMGKGKFELDAIGVIHSPFKTREAAPVQPGLGGQGDEGELELFDAFARGLSDLDHFERIWLIYWMDRCEEDGGLLVKPCCRKELRGVFGTRVPEHPNPLGLSCVQILGIEGRRVKVSGVDIVDGTPLIDIKPYAPRFDAWPEAGSPRPCKKKRCFNA